MGARSASGRRLAGALVAAALACGCATTPPPLPPARTQFPLTPTTQTPRAADLPTPTAPPIRHERYGGWLVAADLAAIVPLVYWMGRREDLYLVAPSLAVGPLLHAAHGQGRNAGISLVLRSAMVGGVYLASRSAESECNDEFICVPIRSVLLAELAIIPVILIDALWLARRTKDVNAWRELPPLTACIDRDGRRFVMYNTSF